MLKTELAAIAKRHRSSFVLFFVLLLAFAALILWIRVRSSANMRANSPAAKSTSWASDLAG